MASSDVPARFKLAHARRNDTTPALATDAQIVELWTAGRPPIVSFTAWVRHNGGDSDVYVDRPSTNAQPTKILTETFHACEPLDVVHALIWVAA